MTTAEVRLWGSRIGAVTWDESRALGVFQYAPEFVESGIEVAPLMMPLRQAPYEFPGLPRHFEGLPGLLADSLPDKFGHRLIDAWLAAQGRSAQSMNGVELLCYIGRRGMGALEYEPATGPSADDDERLEIDALVVLANQVLAERGALHGRLADAQSLESILRVGTSAGGARAKALVAWNPQTGEFRSGQIDGRPGFEQWLLKFDGVSNNRDKELADPQGYGQIEYAYARMAEAAGLEMAECRLHHEGGRSHFMTRRFDRTDAGEKRHILSLAALHHFDYNDPASYSYEQALQTIRRLTGPARRQHDLEQQFLRAVFNVVARNQDDHVKNIAFLMDRAGRWSLSPAFDVVYSWNPDGRWTGRHQMSVNGKRDDFTRDDLLALGTSAQIKARKARERIERVIAAVRAWPEHAREAGVPEETAGRIGAAHRLGLAER